MSTRYFKVEENMFVAIIKVEGNPSMYRDDREHGDAMCIYKEPAPKVEDYEDEDDFMRVDDDHHQFDEFITDTVLYDMDHGLIDDYDSDEISEEEALAFLEKQKGPNAESRDARIQAAYDAHLERTGR